MPTTATALSVRRFRTSDLFRLGHIESETLGEWGQKDFRDTFRTSNGRIYVATDSDGEVLGFICFIEHTDRVTVTNCAGLTREARRVVNTYVRLLAGARMVDWGAILGRPTP